MKAIWVKKQVLVNSLKGEVTFNEELNRYYFIAVSPKRFDKETSTMYEATSVPIGDDSKEVIEEMYKTFKNFFEQNEGKFIKVEKNEKVYVDDDDEISE